jgi:hypothetical protein
MSDAGPAIRSGTTKFTIGRDKDCDVPIADESVSRIHAELTILEGGKLLLADRASSNGTSIMQGGRPRRIHQTYVSPADQVQFGSVVLSVGELIEAIHASAAKSLRTAATDPGKPVSLGEAIGATFKGFGGWVKSHQALVVGRWREAVLVVLILAAAVLLWVGDPQSQSFKFLIGILGSLIASLLFTVLQRLWERK